MWFNQIALGGIVRVASIVNFLDCYNVKKYVISYISIIYP